MHTHLLLFSFAVSFSRRAAVVISGTELARQIQREIQRDVEELVAQGNMRPHLGVVLVGEDPASRTYVKNKTRAASILGKACTFGPCCVFDVEVIGSVRRADSNRVKRMLCTCTVCGAVQVFPVTQWCDRARSPRRSCWS